MYLVSNPHNGKPLSDDNILNYVMSNNDDYVNIQIKESKRLEVRPLLQTDFQEKEDSIFTCLTTCVNYFYPQATSLDEIYEVAVKTYYRITTKEPKDWKINPFIICKVYKEIFTFFNVPFFKVRLNLINNIGFNFNKIKKIIDEKMPVILYMYSDGRNFYKNRSVTVIGYTTFQMENETDDPFAKKEKEINMLAVYDNWSKSVRFVDPNCINMASFIIY